LLRSVRFGIYLPPRKAAIFDLIKGAGDIGITTREVLFALGSPPIASTSIKSHVKQLNDLFEATDWRISSDGRGPHSRWILRRVHR
jgi:hypothetical protein